MGGLNSTLQVAPSGVAIVEGTITNEVVKSSGEQCDEDSEQEIKRGEKAETSSPPHVESRRFRSSALLCAIRLSMEMG